MLGGAGSGLRNGSPGEAGLTERGVAAIGAAASAGLTEATAETGRPYYPGYVVLAGCGDVVALHEAGGDVLRYADREGTELAAGQRIATRPDTVFDIASISKLITSIAVMQQVQDGALELDRPVAGYLPAFGAAGKGSITLRRLLTHTSGLPADPDPALWTYPTATDRVAAVHSTVPVAAPGAAYCYSDINLMALALLVQHACGATLDAVVGDRITGPLAMADTGYRPAAPRERIAPTEYEHDPDRGLVWGGVHDENARSLD
ncbi:MAG: serine hydrolase domain-containing protein, partial [Mycobacteriales bacterium]